MASMLDIAVPIVMLVVFASCMCTGGLSDLASMRIPNRVSVVLVATFVLLAPVSGISLALYGTHLLAGVAVFAVGFALFAANVIGGGDAKMIAATAVWFGLSGDLADFLVSTAIAGGVLALCILALRAAAGRLAGVGIPLPAHFHDARAGLPYGVAIAFAGLVTIMHTPLAQMAIARFHA
ncbi:A24 family peptidase [Pararhizobium mangrovi]|nr:prepilin peptidase [Pararhizobium mangrovi]